MIGTLGGLNLQVLVGCTVLLILKLLLCQKVAWDHRWLLIWIAHLAIQLAVAMLIFGRLRELGCCVLCTAVRAWLMNLQASWVCWCILFTALIRGLIRCKRYSVVIRSIHGIPALCSLSTASYIRHILSWMSICGTIWNSQVVVSLMESDRSNRLVSILIAQRHRVVCLLSVLHNDVLIECDLVRSEDLLFATCFLCLMRCIATTMVCLVLTIVVDQVYWVALIGASSYTCSVSQCLQLWFVLQQTIESQISFRLWKQISTYFFELGLLMI